MDSLNASGKGVVLHNSMHLHVDTGHHLQSVPLFGIATMEEETTDGITLIGMEEMVLTVHARL